MDLDTYVNYAALAAAHVEGRDYRVTVKCRRPATSVAIIAPHAGGIEYRTTDIAEAIAGEQYSLYMFEGIMDDNNGQLHVTSHHFDEPRCLKLVQDHEVVVTIHGCQALNGLNDAIYVGGLDETRKDRIAKALKQANFDARIFGHQFQGSENKNICNRGTTGKGVQLEFSRPLRNDLGLPRLADAIRTALQL